jgi:hypothetical protein
VTGDAPWCDYLVACTDDVVAETESNEANNRLSSGDGVRAGSVLIPAGHSGPAPRRLRARLGELAVADLGVQADGIEWPGHE